MDPDLLLIFSFIIIVTAIIGMSVNGIVQKSLDYKRSINAAKSPEGGAKVTEVLERTQAIEDRLAVLERIATDPDTRHGALLAEEIEALVDGRAERLNEKEIG
ncbi:MAG: hypothetical protein AAFQ13_05120 [Pseudomonadota bacterium]